MLVCLITLATILFIYGLFYEVVQENLIEYTHELIDFIKNEMVLILKLIFEKSFKSRL